MLRYICDGARYRRRQSRKSAYELSLVLPPDQGELRIANTANDLKDARGFCYLILGFQKRALINGRRLNEGLLFSQ